MIFQGPEEIHGVADNLRVQSDYDGYMELPQESSKNGVLPTITSRNLSSSSSAFVSACQSPFFSPRSPKLQGTESNSHPAVIPSNNLDNVVRHPLSNLRFTAANVSPLPSSCPSNFGDTKILHKLSPSSSINGSLSDCSEDRPEHKSKRKKGKVQGKFLFTRGSALLSSTKRPRTCDVYIGFHGRKPSLLRFTNWLRAELESHGISCFAADRARCRNSRSHDTVARAMNSSSFGVVILSKKSFGNPYSMEELVNFLAKKNLVPIFFDLGASDCIARDIIERRGELWEKHGGELWMLYGGLEKEWKEAVDGLMRMDDWKLEAHDGNLRDCISNAVILLATRLERRSAVERVNKWRERVEKEEFPFPRNENFVGRKKELSELELILFGDVSGDGEREFFELKPKHRRRTLLIRRNENNKTDESGKEHQSGSSNKGKDPVIWKESENEIEMEGMEVPQWGKTRRPKGSGRYDRRKKPTKLLYGKGVACVSGEYGIGKTELVLEYAYRFSQRYKMILWIGGETRYIRQNYLNMRALLDVDVGIENHCLKKCNVKSFEKQEEEAISRLRKELMRDIPFLVIIDNLDSEKDWWDRKNLMDLLPRFGGETHFIITTRLPRVMNLEPLKLSFLSGVEAISLMKGNSRGYPISEIDALRTIEERLGRVTLGFGIIGSILSELPLSPSRLLDTINRMPLKDLNWNEREALATNRHGFLIRILEVCFSIFDHADGSRSLATRMVQASGWFAPSAIPIPLLALAAHKVPDDHHKVQFWKKLTHIVTCGFTESQIKKSETEAASMLVRFGMARSSSSPDSLHFHELIRLYGRKRGTSKAARAMVTSISLRGSISQHTDHLWAACFLLFGFGADPIVVEPKPSEFLFLVKQVVLPLSIQAFITFSRCNAALELLRLCTDALEISAESLLSRVEKWYDETLCCWRPIHSDAQHTHVWQELALLKATVMETRTKLLLRGGQYDIADDLIRKAIFIRTSIKGEDHPDTVSARETLTKLTRLRANVQFS